MNHRLTWLIGILSILLQEEKTTAPELAERFEVSRRTINRDIEDLCKAGIPIKTAQGTGGGISIMDGYRMDRTILSSKDMQMILAGLRSLDSLSGSRYYSQLMEKIQTGSSEFISGRDSMLIDLSSWYKGSLERINKVGNKVGKKVGDKKPLNSRRQKIIAEMRDNPNITTAELHNILGVSETAVENNISFLRENGYIERVGSKKAGYWKVL